MAQIDLSSGLVPKQPAAPAGVDLSTGLVPKDQAQQQPMSMIQRARAFVDRLSTAQDDPNASAVSNAASRFGAGVIANTAGVINHPVDAVVNAAKGAMPDAGVKGFVESALGPAGPMAVHFAQSFAKDPANAAGGLVGGALLGEAAAPLVRAGVRIVSGAPAAAKAAVVGSNIDKPIPGEVVTPRQQFQIAKDQGVQLDAAQATGSPALATVKKVTNATVGGAPAFGDNFAQNVNALQIHAENLLDKATPQAMTREEFGNAGKAALLEDLATKKADAGNMFDQLTDQVGDRQPAVKNTKAQAQAIVDANKDYYAKHPELLKGGTRSAWQIIQNLADAPDPGTPAAAGRPPDTWSDLHMLRSDLMDITRGPEMIGDRATGWVKQMTAAVDKDLTSSSSGLTAPELKTFRQANDLYSAVKDTYDNPQHPLYHVVRQPDGLTAANQIAQMKPAIAKQFKAAVGEQLTQQLQRQTIDRILRPQGNEVPDLQNLPTRFKNLPKEQLGGILDPGQVIDLENLARTSRQVHSTDNPSGTANKAIPTAEIAGAGGAFTEAGRMAMQGEPVSAALTAAAPVAWYAGTRAASRAITSPAVVERLMQTPGPKGGPVVSPAVSRAVVPAAVVAVKGQDRWASLGAAKLADHIERMGDKAEISAEDVDALSKTPQGKQLLIQASDLEPGSAAMRNLVKQIQQVQAAK
jgi:hypothetical protein